MEKLEKERDQMQIRCWDKISLLSNLVEAVSGSTSTSPISLVQCACSLNYYIWKDHFVSISCQTSWSHACWYFHKSDLLERRLDSKARALNEARRWNSHAFDFRPRSSWSFDELKLQIQCINCLSYLLNQSLDYIQYLIACPSSQMFTPLKLTIVRAKPDSELDSFVITWVGWILVMSRSEDLEGRRQHTVDSQMHEISHPICNDLLI